MTTWLTTLRWGLLIAGLFASNVWAEQTEPLDVSEPPFSKFDWTWLNGANYQPASLIKLGPVTPTFFVDTAYAWQFANPVDHTIFPTTTAPRHSEINLNLAYFGFEVSPIETPYGSPLGRLELQFGSYIATIQGQDSTLTRGFFLSNPAMSFIKQAAAGWHFHWLHGVNVELGIFPSYIALESYTPQENWNYTHPFVSDFTPYYFSGVRTQMYLKENTKLELWLINGWQSLGRWHDSLTAGYLYTVRPTRLLALTHTLYAGRGQTRASDPMNQSFRAYSDNHVQLLAFENLERRFFQRLAFALVADLGFEYRGSKAGEPVDGQQTPPNGFIAGGSFSARVEWNRYFMSTFRADIFYDASAAVIATLPIGSPYSLPGNGSATNRFEWLGGGIALTADCRPSPWLLARLEYARRWANQPYFSGSAGITGPNGMPTAAGQESTFTPDLRRSDDRVVLSVTLRM